MTRLCAVVSCGLNTVAGRNSFLNTHFVCVLDTSYGPEPIPMKVEIMETSLVGKRHAAIHWGVTMLLKNHLRNLRDIPKNV